MLGKCMVAAILGFVKAQAAGFLSLLVALAALSKTHIDVHAQSLSLLYTSTKR